MDQGSCSPQCIALGFQYRRTFRVEIQRDSGLEGPEVEAVAGNPNYVHIYHASAGADEYTRTK